ncbi:hypothetical protein [Actinomadura xylanilytica]|uniref:hypothetical protein n=1 Tax=Actinomadura xylanilytica TaxID=887459 RepID=UPI00255AFD67|nr:hypothetical protein [Actinomadura xylanilytica]
MTSAEPSPADSTMFVPPPMPAWAPAPADPAPAPSSASPTSADPEATAAWTIEDDPDTPMAGSPAQPSGNAPAGGFGAPPPPAWANDQPGPGAPPAAFGTETANESIVPDSWFAQPRKPDVQPDPGPEMWTPQPPPDQAWGGGQVPQAVPGGSGEADATMVVGPSADGATQFVPGPAEQPSPLDQTRFDQSPVGQGMQMPPVGQGAGAGGFGGPMGPGPMGPGGMGPGGMGPGGMGPGAMPMGPGGGMGPGDPMGPGGFGGPMGQGGPGGQGGTMDGFGGYPQSPPPHSGGQASKPLIISVCALVAVALVAVCLVMWPDGKNKPSATPSASSSNKQQVAEKQKLPGPARAQAGSVNELLNASSDTRKILTRALGASRTCRDLPQAINGFRSVAQRRQNQLRRTQSLQVDQLQNGEKLRAYLRQSFQSSLEVDQVLLKWAEFNQRKCKGRPRPDAGHVPGRAVGEKRATAAKQHFVALWNPVAKSTGQPQRRWTSV